MEYLIDIGIPSHSPTAESEHILSKSSYQNPKSYELCPHQE